MRRPGFAPGSGQVGFVLEKVALGQVFFKYFGFPCQSSFHQILHPLRTKRIIKEIIKKYSLLLSDSILFLRVGSGYFETLSISKQVIHKFMGRGPHFQGQQLLFVHKQTRDFQRILMLSRVLLTFRRGLDW
jgi:hypothetical protein